NTPPISMSQKTGAGGADTTPVNSNWPQKNTIIHVAIMPINKAPVTYRANKINVIKRPASVNNVIGSYKSPNPTIFASFGITIPDIFKPRKAINKPIPEVIPNLREGG